MTEYSGKYKIWKTTQKITENTKKKSLLEKGYTDMVKHRDDVKKTLKISTWNAAKLSLHWKPGRETNGSFRATFNNHIGPKPG